MKKTSYRNSGNIVSKVFRYLEPLWIGKDKRISLRSTLSICFSIDFISNLSHAIYKWDAGRSLEGLSLTLGIEAGLIVALLGLKTYQNMIVTKSDNDYYSGHNGSNNIDNPDD